MRLCAGRRLKINLLKKVTAASALARKVRQTANILHSDLFYYLALFCEELVPSCPQTGEAESDQAASLLLTANSHGTLYCEQRVLLNICCFAISFYCPFHAVGMRSFLRKELTQLSSNANCLPLYTTVSIYLP